VKHPELWGDSEDVNVEGESPGDIGPESVVEGGVENESEDEGGDGDPGGTIFGPIRGSRAKVAERILFGFIRGVELADIEESKSNVSVGDTCKEIGVLRHGSDNADEDPDA